MNEIEPGEYIRTNKGNIGKVIGTFDGHCTAKYHIEFQGNVKVKRQYLSTKTILKHSKNIIDLIEIGDILEILCNELNKETNMIEIKNNEQLEALKLVPKNIKSIITKEQLESIKYKI